MDESRIDVLVVTALKDELDALLDLEVDGTGRDAWSEERDRHDFPFHVRELSNEHGEPLRLAAAWSGKMGETAATERAGTLIDELEPVCLAMCGICAGQRGEVFLGDVIVANRVYAYDQGKHIAPSEGREEQFLHDIETYNLQGSWGMDATFFADEFQRSWEGVKMRPPSKDSQRRWLLHTLYAHESEGGPAPLDHPERKTRCPGWASRIQELKENGFLKKARGPLQLTKKGYSHVEDERMLDPEGERAGDPPFRVHVGPIATGKAVKEDPKLFELLKRSVRKVIGVEMEGAAIGFVAERRARRSLIVKAVTDHADLDKDDAYRRFACRASATFLVDFLRKYLNPRELDDETARKAGRGRSSRREDKYLRESRHGEFLNRVEAACKLHEPEGTRILRRAAPSPFDEILEVSVPKGRFPRVFPLAILDQSPTDELLEDFIQKVHAPYERENPRVLSTLVHIGVAAPEELARKAHQRQVDLVSFAEYQGLIDFSAYLQRQTARLENDPIYPPELYVPQRALVSVGGQGDTSVENMLDALREILGSPGPRFALVLGDFGTGKTFLLHELARRMGSENASPIPVLIEMRSLQKGRRLRELVAQHFAAADNMGRMEVDKFLYMLREGRIVLLLDGFDELALRVTYEQVMKHFDTLLEAAEGDAKVIITSRTQHFLTDYDVKRELAHRAEALRGYRLIKLQRFSEGQIRRFLVNWLKSEEAAEEYLHLLRDVRDLLGLSENPRLLSFIVGLGVEKLRSAREGSGEITSAKLYQLLIDQWIEGEHARVNPEGAPKGLTRKQLRGAANDLAMLLWKRTERAVSVDELPAELVAAVNAGGEHPVDAEVIKHQLGSGSLLVRDAEGRFFFIHQSVLEWLVAESSAEEVRTKGDSSALSRNEMSDLMADFFTQLAGRKVAQEWAEARISSSGDNVAQRNALRVLGRLRKSSDGLKSATKPVVIKNFAKGDLRGQDLSKEDLRQAILYKGNFSSVTLVEANLENADLREGQFIRADLERVKLAGADLTGANLTGARLLGADLRGAIFQGTKLRAAKLIGAQVNSLEGCDLFGAAMPVPAGLETTMAAASPCRAVAFSQTDELLATGHEDGTVRLWDSVTGRALRVYKGHSDHVRSIAFSPDGVTLASGSSDKTVRLWSVADGRLQRVLEGHSGNVSSVAFSPNGVTLASGSSDRTARLWSVADGMPLRVSERHLGNVWSVAFSPDGTTFASGAADGMVRLWSVADGRLQRVLEGHSGNVWSVAFSPDGATLAAGSSERSVRLWSVADGRLQRVLEGPSGNVWSVAFSPDGTTLASGSSDETVRLWSVAEGRPLRVLEGPSGNVWSVAFSLDGATIASGSEDKAVRLWSVAEGRPLHVLDGHSGNVLSIAFSSDATTLASSSEGGMVQLWSVAEGRPVHVLQGRSGNVWSVAFSPDGATLASSSEDGMVQLWSAAEGKPLRVLKEHSGHVLSVAFSPDGAILASGSLDRTIRLWSVADGRRQRILKGHSGHILSVAFSPDGATLASGSSDETVSLWSVAEGRPLRVLKGHSDYVRSVAFSPDGATLASGAEDGKVRLWRVAEGRPLHVLEGHSDYVRSVAFSSDGVFLASGSEDGTVRLWSVTEGKPLRVLKGHTGGVCSVAFSPEKATFASSSEDGTVRFWDATTGACLAVFLKLPNGWVSFRPEDGRYKLGGDISGAFWHSVGLCRFEPGELDPYLPTPLQIPYTEPLLPSSR